jgi:hypothetical protein
MEIEGVAPAGREGRPTAHGVRSGVWKICAFQQNHTSQFQHYPCGGRATSNVERTTHDVLKVAVTRSPSG